MKFVKSSARIAAVLLCLAALTSASFAASSLNNPRGLAVDSKGNLWVANVLGGTSQTGNILVYSPSYVLQPTMTITNNISLPNNVAFDGFGNLWVSNFGNSNGFPNGSIAVYTNGTQVRNATIFEQIASPSAMAIDGLNNIWVYNAGTGTITVYQEANPYVQYMGLFETITPLSLPVNAIAETANVVSWSSSSGVWIVAAMQALTGFPNAGNYIPGKLDGVALANAAGGITYIGNSDGTVDVFTGFALIPFVTVPFVPAGMAVDNVRGRVYISSGFGNTIAVYNTAGKLLHTIR